MRGRRIVSMSQLRRRNGIRKSLEVTDNEDRIKKNESEYQTQKGEDKDLFLTYKFATKIQF